MAASPTLLLLSYCAAIFCVASLGGFLPRWVRMTHTRMQLIMSMVSGLMLGVAFYHLLPHSIAMAGGEHAVDDAVWWLMVGLIVMLLLLRLFHFHQHEFSDDDCAGQQVDHHHGHAHAHAHVAGTVTEQAAHPMSWMGLALGLGIHTLMDGLALGAIMRTGHVGTSSVLGLGVFLAIFLHKPLDAISIATVMEAGGWSRAARTTMNLVFALLCPLGAVLFYFGVGIWVENPGHWVAIALAFSAGTFICIALSDLLPEVHFHSHDRVKLTLAFLLGISLAYAIGMAEPEDAHSMHQHEAHHHD